MPRYDASQDADLRKAVQHAREKQFFLGQYRKRKFISDKSAFFDETVSNKFKKLVLNISISLNSNTT